MAGVEVEVIAVTAGLEDESMANRSICWAFLFGLATSLPAAGAEPLESRVDRVLATKKYERAHWGLLVVDATTGSTLYERNADQFFCPASVTKLFTTAAALADLGADYRFQTPIVRRGEVGKDGTLKGDLILVARGDLSLGGRTGPEGTLLFRDHDHTYAGGHFEGELVPVDPLSGLDQLAREVHAAGIKTISGDVLVDDRYFDSNESSGSGPSRVGPIIVNDNLIDVLVTPSAKAGEPASVAMIPATSFASMEAKVETVAAGGKPRLE
ncbi:D-alanyl-D-alanine carboxypeptidase, partial [Singulisphaera rosea]